MKLERVLACLIVILGVINITLSNFSLDDAPRVGKLESEISSLKHANLILKAEIAERGSLTKTVEELALSSFSLPDNIVALEGGAAVASR